MNSYPQVLKFWSLAGKTHLVSFDWSTKTYAIDVKMVGSVNEEKSSTFPSKLDWGLTLSLLLKVPPRKLGIPSMKFLSPEVALYL